MGRVNGSVRSAELNVVTMIKISRPPFEVFSSPTRPGARVLLNPQEGAVFKGETRLKSTVQKSFNTLYCAFIFILRLPPDVSTTHTNKVKFHVTEMYSELFVLVLAY